MEKNTEVKEEKEEKTYQTEMETYIPTKTCLTLWDNKKKIPIEAEVKRFIRSRSSKRDKLTTEYVPIIIPQEITTLISLQKWIYIYLKLVRFYKLVAGSPLARAAPDPEESEAAPAAQDQCYFSTLNPHSIYELMGYIYNHKKYHERYNKSVICKREHKKRNYGYSFHSLEIDTFREITFEMSELL